MCVCEGFFGGWGEWVLFSARFSLVGMRFNGLFRFSSLFSFIFLFSTTCGSSFNQILFIVFKNEYFI